MGHWFESSVAQSKKKRIRQDSFFYSDLHTGFDPRERPERREGEAQEVPRANEAAWREVAGSHRPEGESSVAQSKKKESTRILFFTLISTQELTDQVTKY